MPLTTGTFSGDWPSTKTCYVLWLRNEPILLTVMSCHVFYGGGSSSVDAGGVHGQFTEVEGCSKFMVETKDLSLTTSLGPESMLVVVENVIFLQVFYRVAHNDMF